MKLTFLYNPYINFKNNFSKYLNDLRVDDNFLIFFFIYPNDYFGPTFYS